MHKRPHYVYILANKVRSIYVGVTDELVRRVTEHQEKFSQTALVYFEECEAADEALAREREIKGWRRTKKVELIESLNPTWADLSDPALRSG